MKFPYMFSKQSILYAHPSCICICISTNLHLYYMAQQLVSSSTQHVHGTGYCDNASNMCVFVVVYRQTAHVDKWTVFLVKVILYKSVFLEMFAVGTFQKY